jgi:hypothetical protein
VGEKKIREEFYVRRGARNPWARCWHSNNWFYEIAPTELGRTRHSIALRTLRTTQITRTENMANLVRCMSLALLACLAAGQSVEVVSVEGPGVRAGLEQLAEAVAGVRDTVQQKKAQFMDQAGNVYDVVQDTAGMATNMVRDRLGEVYDVTKMAGSWLYEGAANYPSISRQSGREAIDSLRATAADIIDSSGEILRAAKDAIPEFPEKEKMLDRNQWISKMALNQMYMDRCVYMYTHRSLTGCSPDGRRMLTPSLVPIACLQVSRHRQ